MTSVAAIVSADRLAEFDVRWARWYAATLLARAWFSVATSSRSVIVPHMSPRWTLASLVCYCSLMRITLGISVARCIARTGCIILLLVPALAVAADVYIVPSCPNTAVPVTVVTMQRPLPPAFLSDGAIVTRSANKFTVVLNASGSYFPETPSSAKTVDLGQLPMGSYHVDVLYRYETIVPGVYGPEQLAGATDFVVTAGTETSCVPGAIFAVEGAAQQAALNSPFPSPLGVLLTDLQSRPIPDVLVRFERLRKPGEDALTPGRVPLAVLSQSTGSTNASGFVRVPFAIANDVVGSYQYAAYATVGDKTLIAYFLLSNRPTSVWGVPVVPVVEFYNQTRDHYFMTGSQSEMIRLDHGVLAPGWRRTGETFLAYPSGTPSVGGSQPVCRFYGLPEAGLDSHFFSASTAECKEVVERFSASWILETPEALVAFLPDLSAGACQPVAQPLYRAYNGRPDANHRYSTSSKVIDGMVAAGWIREGYGPAGAAMCVPR